MAAVADRAGTRAQWDPVRTGHSGGSASLPPAHTGAAGCASEQCRARAGPGLRGHGVESGGKAGQAGRARLLGAWSTVLCSEVWPCRGQIPGGGPRQAHLGHCLPLTPLPSQGGGCPRGGQMWPGPHPTCLLVPDTSRKKEGHGGGEGDLALGVRLYVCKLRGQPPAFPRRDPGLGPHEAAGWPSAAPGLAHSPELAPSLCQAGQARATAGRGLPVLV